MRKKMLLSSFVVLLVGILITGISPIGYIKSIITTNEQQKLLSLGKLIADSLSAKYSTSSADYDSVAAEYENMSGARVTIIAPDGKVLGESRKISAEMENHSDRTEVRKAISGGNGVSVRYSSTEGMEMMYAAVPMKVGGKVAAVIRLSVPFTGIKRIQDYIYRSMLLAMLAGLVAASIIMFCAVSNYTKSIEEITSLSSQIAGGRYDRRINIRSGDELSKLADSFNDMAAKLQTTIDDLHDKSNKLEAILKSMPSGLIAIGNDGKVILINDEAASMFNLKGNVLGKHILEVIRNAELQDIIDNHIDDEEEIVINCPDRKVLKIKATPISDTDISGGDLGVVIGIQDITELKRLEQVRSDFVDNVSHELKTPITSIKGFTETLKSGAVTDKAAAERFLDIIDVEADRLTRLINDLIVLSGLENNRTPSQPERVDMNKCADAAVEVMYPPARRKDIQLTLEKQRIPFVSGFGDRAKQMLIDLIDNAIKYTPGGGHVKISTYHRNGSVYIEVADDGIGIEKDQIPRIFERFYRVDKARSRAVGGTGLGLAIVKHTVISMGGSIDVRSEPGKGSIFTVVLPESQ